MQNCRDMDSLSLKKGEMHFDPNYLESSIQIVHRPCLSSPTNTFNEEEIQNYDSPRAKTDRIMSKQESLQENLNTKIAQNFISFEKMYRDFYQSQIKINSDLSLLSSANLPLSINSLSSQIEELNQLISSSSQDTNERLKNIEESMGNFEKKIALISELIENKICNDSLEKPIENVSNPKIEISAGIVTEKEKIGTHDEYDLLNYSNIHENCILNIELRIQKLEDLISKNATQFYRLEEMIEKVNLSQIENKTKLSEDSSGNNEAVSELKEKINSLFNLTNDTFQVIKERLDKTEVNLTRKVPELEIENTKTNLSIVKKDKGHADGDHLEKCESQSTDTTEDFSVSFNSAYLELSKLVRLH